MVRRNERRSGKSGEVVVAAELEVDADEVEMVVDVVDTLVDVVETLLDSLDEDVGPTGISWSTPLLSTVRLRPTVFGSSP
jgi:hypothetical protein